MKMAIKQVGGDWRMVSDRHYSDEAHLQKLLYENPELIPIEDLGEDVRTDCDRTFINPDNTERHPRSSSVSPLKLCQQESLESAWDLTTESGSIRTLFPSATRFPLEIYGHWRDNREKCFLPLCRPQRSPQEAAY